MAAWLHDCGKVTTPEYVVDKATKLETIHDRIHEIRTRFEVLKRDAWVDYWQARATTDSDEQALAATRDTRLQALTKTLPSSPSATWAAKPWPRPTSIACAALPNVPEPNPDDRLGVS